MKQRKEITVSKYVLDKVEELHVSNFSGLIENLMLEWIKDHSYSMHKCLKCETVYAERLMKCPHCQSHEYTTIWVNK